MRLVTVFLPTYNGEAFVRETVRTLLAQTHADFELIALDDGSVDETIAAIETFADPRLRVLRFRPNLGAAHNWNRALEMAQTPYFAICHQDDVYHPEFLAELLALLRAHPDAFIAHCRAETIDERGQLNPHPADRYKESFWPPGSTYLRRGRAELAALRRGSYVVTPAVLYRREATRRIGLFSTAYRQSIDWDYWLRGVLAGFAVAGTRRRLARYRRHPGMTTCRTEADFTRYREEVRLLGWIADAAFGAGLTQDPRADYSIVGNTLLSKLAQWLASARLDDARTLLDFAEAHVPGFAGSKRHRLARAACALGPSGGRCLQIAESACFSLLDFWNRLPTTGAARLHA